jgi:hypothetical protein
VVAVAVAGTIAFVWGSSLLFARWLVSRTSGWDGRTSERFSVEYKILLKQRVHWVERQGYTHASTREEARAEVERIDNRLRWIELEHNRAEQ